MFRVELTEQEMQHLAGLLDAGVRATGLRGVKEAALLLAKIEQAQQTVKNDTSGNDNTSCGNVHADRLFSAIGNNMSAKQFQFSDQEVAMLKTAIDAWCRQNGANVAVAAASLLIKLNGSAPIAAKPTSIEPADPK